MAEDSFLQLLIDAHKRGLKKALEDSIRTGVPLIEMRCGKIVEVPPKYKYVKVPIKSKKAK